MICMQKNSIVINEVSSNNFIYYDDTEAYAGDYIELYNPSYTTVSLAGYVLSDEDYTCDLSAYSIQPHSYIVVSTNSIDNKLGFGLNANGEKVVLSYNGKVIDSIEVPELEKDTFYMRQEDGKDKWIKVTEATPNQTNNNATNSKYPSLDGTEPNTESLVYEGPIKLFDYSVTPNKYSAIENTSAESNYLPNYLVDKANVIKAMVVNEDGERSHVAANTFFVGFDDKNGYDNIMIMSMIIDEDDFFSNEKGIYVLGKTYADWVGSLEADYDLSNVPSYLIPANYYIRGKKSERDVHIELFDKDRKLIEEGDDVVKLHGAASSRLLNKTLAINSYNKESIFNNDKYTLRTRDVIFAEALTQSLVSDREIGIQDNMGVCALSIVRFRTAIKEPMDLVFLLWAISVGIICGAGFAIIAVIASFVTTIVIILFEMFSVGKAPVILLVNATDYKSEKVIEHIINNHCTMYKVKARNLTKQKLDMAIEVHTNMGIGLLEELMAVESVVSASLLDHDGEVTF